MQARFLKTTWKTTPAVLEAAGVTFKVSALSKTKAKQFSLFQVHEWAKRREGGVAREEVERAADREVESIRAQRENYARFREGGAGAYGGGGKYEDGVGMRVIALGVVRDIRVGGGWMDGWINE